MTSTDTSQIRDPDLREYAEEAIGNGRKWVYEDLGFVQVLSIESIRVGVIIFNDPVRWYRVQPDGTVKPQSRPGAYY